MSTPSEVLTSAAKGKVIDRIRMDGDNTELHFEGGSVLVLYGNGRKVMREEKELCAACSVTPSSVSTMPVTKEEVLAALDAKLGPAKPPTQSVAPAGATFTEFGRIGAPSAYDWDMLVKHPPFQAFVAAQQGVLPGDQLVNTAAFVTAQSKLMTEVQAFQAYASWFHAQGRWPAEDALGKALEAQ